MKRHFTLLLLSISTVAVIQSCSTTPQLYRFNTKNKTYTGKLSDSTFMALKHFLTTNTSAILKDTIIIKYDYNNENCWSILDQSEDSYIMGFVTRKKERVTKVLAKRQNISVFGFREPGNNLNKIIKWDNSILIDNSKQLYNLLFREQCTCGNSILVMPDNKFVFIRSDSHSEILELTSKKIEEMLNKK